MSITHPFMPRLIEIARTVARAEILPRFRNLSASEIDTKSGPQDLVTIADRRAEAAITRAMAVDFPGCTVVGEEAVAEEPALLDQIATSADCLIVDPIDGTGNFVAGLAHFGVIMALTRSGVTEFGLLYDPIVDDWIVASRGQGAWFGRPGQPLRRLTTRRPRPLAEAEGFISMGQWRAKDRSARLARFAPVGHVRSLRCSCHEYRVVAMGNADFNHSLGRMPWDHAAGLLAVDEAGGVHQAANGEPYEPARSEGPIWAASSQSMLDALRHAGLAKRCYS